MTKIINYNKDETLATGFVKPKVTALFFLIKYGFQTPY